MMAQMQKQCVLPGETLKTKKMPGHWMLARIGKRVLRPGGIETTQRMLDALNIGTQDEVVELAPGLGITTQMTLKRNPKSYTAVERDETAARSVESLLSGSNQRCLVGDAAHTGLPDQSATVVYGEAMLTMQTNLDKECIIAEASRLLRSEGRYGIHEICFTSQVDTGLRQEIEKDFSATIHHGVHPLLLQEWHSLFQVHDFTIEFEQEAPLHLLEPKRILHDEG